MANPNKRISKELADLQQNPPEGMKVSLVEDDLFKWQILMDGPKESPYAGGKFKILVTLPESYPFKPPVINWQTKIYHPNVTNDDKGSMCLGILRDGEWKPNSRLQAAFEYIRQLLVEPNADDAVEAAVGREYKEDHKEYLKKAKKWTKDHATK